MNNNSTSIPEEDVFIFPASFAQQRLWFLNQLAPDNPFYNVSTAIRLTGSLNIPALEQTFNEIVRRHETLRTGFLMLEGEPVQVIAPSAILPLPVINLEDLSPTQRETEALRLATIEAQRPFNLTNPPLLRIQLLQLSCNEYVLLLNLHHIVADGWSIGVLIQELGTLYTAFINEQPSPLPELPLQYADFAEWQRQYLQGEILEAELQYWRKQLEGISELTLPIQKTRPPIPTYKGAYQTFALERSLTQALETLSEQAGVTLFMTLLAAFQTLLHRYTEQDDIVVGSPIANRNRQEIEGLIGFFVNSLVLRTRISENLTFIELLEQVKKVTLEAYTHQDLPFEKLVDLLHPERDLSRNPLFQIGFSLQNTPIKTLTFPHLNLSLAEFDSKTAKLDLEFHLWQDAEGLKGKAIYSTDLFDEAIIDRMIGHFNILLSDIVLNPHQLLSRLNFLTETEKRQFLEGVNKSGIDHKKIEAGTNKFDLFKTVQLLNSRGKTVFTDFFELQANSKPDAIAVVFENQQLTYNELNQRANQLAHHLQHIGVKPEVLVGIYLDRSLDTIVAILAVLKAGGAYLPLDPTYPQERLNFILEDAPINTLVTTYLPCSPPFGRGDVAAFANINIVNLEADKEIIARQSTENITNNVTVDNLAYVIYTSGSTGKPKGVLVEHRGLSNLVKAQIETFDLQPEERILQFASLNFDASIFEIVMALANGATLYLGKQESLLPGKPLIQFLQDNEITTVTLPPAVLAVLPEAELPALKTIICAGETCSQEIVQRWAKNRRFFNAYGPTEATVWSTVAEITDVTNQPSIGCAIAHTQIYLLDKYLQPVPTGFPGELYITGAGVARGYLNRPDLTAECFISNPFNTSSTSRLYKTGDKARYLPDGNIEFLGRIDNQVKIRGFRIELGEIEAVLRQHPEVREAVVNVIEEIANNKQLIAYIVPHPETIYPKSSGLRQFLKQKLPDYMVPSTYILLESLPLTPNGKINRKALPDSSTQNLKDTTLMAARTPTELTLTQIWAEVLNLETVGIEDNFFDLGGNSLLAIRLMDRIHKQFQRELALSTLFLNPTVETLAAHLYSNTDSLPWSPLVPIQPQGNKPPFWCVHPILGVVFPYYQLAHYLGKDRPFYGLQPLGMDGEQTPLTRIEDIAAYYIEALRQVQPQGPYFIGGWSFGGLVAFEMARQLEKAGDEVAQVALLDTAAPVGKNKPSIWDGLKFLLTTVPRSLLPFILDYFYLATTGNSPKESPKKLHSLLGKAAIANLIPDKTAAQMLNSLTLSAMLRVFQANSQATLNYTPEIYPKPITLFTTKTHRHPTQGWDALTTEPVKTYPIPGNHLTMLQTPHVKVLAEQITKSFECHHR